MFTLKYYQELQELEKQSSMTEEKVNFRLTPLFKLLNEN